MEQATIFFKGFGIGLMDLMRLDTSAVTDESAAFLGLYVITAVTVVFIILVDFSIGVWGSGGSSTDDGDEMDFLAYQDLKKVVEEGGNFQRKDWIAVDCQVPLVDCITHHRNSTTPSDLKGDSSTALVISAIEMDHEILKGRKNVTCNHFDIDGLLSVLCAMYPKLALAHKDKFIMAARVGDFRLLDLSLELADLALKVCCVVNALERENFTLPFEACDSPKWPFFLEEVDPETLITNPTAVAEIHKCDWETEYKRVLSDYKVIRDEKISNIDQDEQISLCVLTTPSPCHYYASFNAAEKCDTLVSIYDGNKYEVEQRYTGYVNLTSRSTLPRVDMVDLATQLNQLESNDKCHWVANRMVDSGPLLRLEHHELSKLDRVQRYMNPYQRRILSSSIDPIEFTAIVTKYFQQAYHAIDYKMQAKWSWEELHAVNQQMKDATK